MSPSHAELQAETFAALNTATYLQRLAASVKLPAWKAFDHAEAAIQAVQHSLDDGISFGFWNAKYPEFISDQSPVPIDGMKVLEFQIRFVAKAIGQDAIRKPTSNSRNCILLSVASPVDKTMLFKLLMSRIEMLRRSALI